MKESRCRRCRRRLTDPVSVGRGIGPVCTARMLGRAQLKGQTCMFDGYEAAIWQHGEEVRKMRRHRTCPDCGAHLDPQERCDCKDAKESAQKGSRPEATGTAKG